MSQYHDTPYLQLAQDILDNGVLKVNRTGVDTLAVFSKQMRFNLSDGTIPLLTTKKMHTRSVIYEILWYLQGGDNIQYLNDNGVTIWDEWADEQGNLGPVYGYQWRKWPKYTINHHNSDMTEHWTRDSDYAVTYHKASVTVEYIDQVAELINKLRTNPNDRRLIVSAWNVSDLDRMALPPCHYTVQFFSRELTRMERVVLEGSGRFDASHENLDNWGITRRALSCMLNQRSCDLGLGVPFNIVQYSILTHMIAHVTNHHVGEFIWNGGDVHIYANHIEQLQMQMRREPLPSPTLELNPEVKEIDDFNYDDFQIINYEHHPLIKMEVAV